MESVTPYGVHRPVLAHPGASGAPARSGHRIRKKSPAAVSHEFPDPRLFDFDENGTVDASDVIQEKQVRQLVQAKQKSDDPVAKYVEQTPESEEQKAVVEPVKAENKLDVHA